RAPCHTALDRASGVEVVRERITKGGSPFVLEIPRRVPRYLTLYSAPGNAAPKSCTPDSNKPYALRPHLACHSTLSSLSQVPDSTRRNTARSTLPPERTRPTRFPCMRLRSLSSAARGAAPAPSATL